MLKGSLVCIRGVFCDLNLVAYDDYDHVHNVGYTYEGLDSQLFIDHVFIHKSSFNKLK